MKQPLAFTDLSNIDTAAVRISLDQDGISSTLPISIPARRKLHESKAISYLVQKSIQNCLGLHEIRVDFVRSTWRSCPNLVPQQQERKLNSSIPTKPATSSAWSRSYSETERSRAEHYLTSPVKVPEPNIFITTRSRTPTQAHGQAATAKQKAMNNNPIGGKSRSYYQSEGATGGSHPSGRVSITSPPLAVKRLAERSSHNSFQDMSERKYQELARRKFYRDECCSQVLDFLFVGNIEAAYNEHLLCKLSIESIVDISNLEPHQIPRHRKSDCPCTCSLETSHPRARLWLGVNDSENTDMMPYFEDISIFIEAARRKDKNVLVHSLDGNSRAMCAVIQYLMKYHDMNLKRAYNLLRRRWPTMNMNQRFQRTLEVWERRLLPGVQPSLTFEEMNRQSAWQ